MQGFGAVKAAKAVADAVMGKAGEAAGVVLASTGTDTINSLLDLLYQAIMLGGGLWGVWGAVTLAGGLKDQNGPGIQAGMWQLIGGAVICGVAGVVKTLTVGW